MKKSREEVFDIVYDILVKDFECSREDLKPETRLFEDLDLDSIDAVDFLVRLQKLTEKRVNPEDFKKIRTLDDLVNVIEKIINE